MSPSTLHPAVHTTPRRPHPYISLNSPIPTDVNSLSDVSQTIVSQPASPSASVSIIGARQCHLVRIARESSRYDITVLWTLSPLLRLCPSSASPSPVTTNSSGLQPGNDTDFIESDGGTLGRV
ncbi:hypothetical protein Pmani_034042 [Petrolisthes manimaculis]|uniref:Uncharacterized protein n=1 Tax=Petrolisthes manimaculis TaxID=1843537 RepID=A0AAE1NQD0_9EUCA|nr:hypothetical protein Pmani_034042 [Petrolisthes manimaculis]